jgi:ribosomal protein S18 acetylase RimI-like enzyme
MKMTMSSNLEVRQATVEDVNDLAGLFNLYRIFYGQESDEDQARLFLFERMVHRESVIFIVRVKESKKMIGFAQLYPTFSSISIQRSWVLNDLFVLEEYRRQGIAQCLLDEAKKYASLTRAKGIGLSTAKDNESAQRLYKRNGYKKNDLFYQYYLSV